MNLADPLHGILVPILTPLDPDENVDLPSLGRLIDHLIASGAHGLWLLGTTGEFAGLAPDQRFAAVEYTLEHVCDRVPVVINVGDGSTRLALRQAAHAVRSGARMIALTPPHYYLHSMDETAAHYRAVKQAYPDTDLYVYNIPQTVKVRITVPVVLELAIDGTARGIKDSQNDLDSLRQLCVGLTDVGLQDRFRVFAGTRSLIDAAVMLGAHGAIPAVANIAPVACVSAYDAAVAGEFEKARVAQETALAFNALAGVARGGSSSAASIASMKEILRMRGILRYATMTAPLRGLTADEIAELERLASGLAQG